MVLDQSTVLLFEGGTCFGTYYIQEVAVFRIVDEFSHDRSFLLVRKIIRDQQDIAEFSVIIDNFFLSGITR